MVRKHDIGARVDKLAGEAQALHLLERCSTCHYPSRRGTSNVVTLHHGIEGPERHCSTCGRLVDKDGETLWTDAEAGELRLVPRLSIVLEARPGPDAARIHLPSTATARVGGGTVDPEIRARAEAEATKTLSRVEDPAVAAEMRPLLVRGIIERMRGEAST